MKSRIEFTAKLAEVFVNTEGNVQVVLNGVSKPEGPVSVILESNGIVTDGLTIGEEWRVRLERGHNQTPKVAHGEVVPKR